ncbi:MAG: hypothetical protein H6824_01245 [Planctomycetaceae bacterium]|nr:hypothetical protein [Planctomycetaceae bacterium]
MSILGHTEKKGRSATKGTKNEVTASRTYEITSDIADESEIDVIEYVETYIIAVYEEHADYQYISCKDVNVNQSSDDARTWEVTVSFGIIDADEKEADNNPLNQPIAIDYDWQTETRIIEFDINNERLQNSAGDPPSQAQETLVYRLVINVQRNEATFDHNTIGAYAGRVNADVWMGFPANTVQFFPGRTTRQFDPVAGYYYSTTYQFVINTDGYLPLRILDQGFRQLNDDDPATPVYILDAEDEKVSDPVLLDGAGKVLASGLPPVFREYEHIQQLPFNNVFNF